MMAQGSPSFICSRCYAEFCYVEAYWNFMISGPNRPIPTCYHCGSQNVYYEESLLAAMAELHRDLRPVLDSTSAAVEELSRLMREAFRGSTT